MASDQGYWNHQLNDSARQASAYGQDAQAAPADAAQPRQSWSAQPYQHSPEAQPQPQAQGQFQPVQSVQELQRVSLDQMASQQAPQADARRQAAGPGQPASQPQVQAAAVAAEEARPAFQEPAAQARRQSGEQPSAPAAFPAASTPYPQTVQAAPQKKGHGWIVAIVIIVCLFAFMAFCVKACTDSMSSFTSISESGDYGLGGLDQDAVAVLTLDGTIQYDGTACSPEGFKKLLDKASGDSHVKALVLRVNSGGGAATAGEEMAEYLRQFEKPVVVSSASINASAAYEISAQADYIYVAKSTEIGSIGTAMELTDLSGLFEKLGVRMETITSADSKDSSYGYRSLTDEERDYYQDMINQINDMFIDNVAEGRHMDKEAVRKLATGLVFTGVDATENGLADAVGTREDAVAKAAELAGITDYTTTDLYMTNYDLGNLAYLLGESRGSTDELLNLLAQRGAARLSQSAD